MSTTTQQQIPISDIADDIVFLKDGGAALIMQVSAVNFWLLSEREQMAIIYAFGQMLNSLSFSIQIVTLSERLDISSYLKLLDQATSMQKNPLLLKLMLSYRQFIQNTIKENDVLDKKFFVVIPIYRLELGIKSSRENLQIKIKTVLYPRKDQIIRQLGRVGLTADQLKTDKLIELFYNIYNGGAWTEIAPEPVIPPATVNLNPPKQALKQSSPTPAQAVAQAQSSQPIQQSQNAKNHPFVVEELEDNA